MARPIFTVTYTEPRSRLTNFFRTLLAIPHLIIAAAWGYLANVLAYLQWVVILFTGKRNHGMWKMQNAWLGYAIRVWSYYGLMYDKWPNVGPDPAGEPTSYSFEYQAEANRLSNFFRILWVIPAAIVAMVVLIGVYVVLVLSWFAILITARQPKALFSFLAKAFGYVAQLYAYLLLMTDDYPKFGA